MGLLYLIYFPFKIWLRKTGKLTDTKSNQINLSFMCLPFILGGLFYFFGDYRTSSKERLEKISGIKLPRKFKVVKDEYQDMWQDYCIIYEITFDKRETSELINSIKETKYYNPNSIHNGAWKEVDFSSADSASTWIRSNNGYDFSGPEGRINYNINFDTTTNKLFYQECSD